MFIYLSLIQSIFLGCLFGWVWRWPLVVSWCWLPQTPLQTQRRWRLNIAVQRKQTHNLVNILIYRKSHNSCLLKLITCPKRARNTGHPVYLFPLLISVHPTQLSSFLHIHSMIYHLSYFLVFPLFMFNFC